MVGITITVPMAVAAATKPTRPMRATHSGVNSRRPMLAPLYAVARAAGRARSNQGATIELTAAAPIATQPTPLRIAVAKSCDGVVATARPITPAARIRAPADVTRDAAVPGQCWKVRDYDRADEKVHRHRHRYERQWPARPFDDGVQYTGGP
jgi:hypothetical protein